MKYDKRIATVFGSVFDITARIRAELGSLHKTNRGADLAFVDVTLSLEAEGQRLEIETLPFIAKVLPDAGRFLAIPEREGSDGKWYPTFRVTNELRAALTAKVFAHPRVRELAEYAESAIADHALQSAPADEQSDDCATGVNPFA